MTEPTRRRLLAAGSAVGVAALAGCASGSGDPGGSAERVDRTGQDTVEVAVGAEGGYRFAPEHVVVDVGATVVWEWTGEGGGHDVVAEDGAFESAIVDEAGHTFEHAFAEPGGYDYVCTPHQTSGMIGHVEVVE